MNIVDELHAIAAALGAALPAGPITFVSRDTLLRMKRLAGRAIDLADIEKQEAGDGP